MAPLFSVTVVRTAGFSVYQNAKYDASSFIARYTGREEPLITVNRVGSRPNWETVACFGYAGGMAGAFSSIISCKTLASLYALY
jgi:solute carrier family 25 carnitine/acylcarnitine transporter 20/29